MDFFLFYIDGYVDWVWPVTKFLGEILKIFAIHADDLQRWKTFEHVFVYNQLPVVLQVSEINNGCNIY